MDQAIFDISKLPEFAKSLATNMVNRGVEEVPFERMMGGVIHHTHRPQKNSIKDMIQNQNEMIYRHETKVDFTQFEQCVVAIAYCDVCNKCWYSYAEDSRYKRRKQ
jgi:hypothetical protein